MISDDTIRGELRKLKVPEPPDLLSRILASRAKGERPTLPSGDNASIFRRRVAAVALAAAALLALVMGRDWGPPAEEPRLAGPEGFLAGVPLWPRAARAQEITDTSARATYPLLDAIDGSRLARGRWTYAARLITDGIDTSGQGVRTLTVAGGSEPGTLVLTTDQTHRYAKPVGDSIVVRLPGLRVLSHTFYYQSKRHTRDFSRDSVPRLLTWRNVDVEWHGTLYRALLQATPFDRAWRGSVYRARMVGDERHGDIRWQVNPLDMRVTGEEIVTTPAGRFDCWKLEARFRWKVEERLRNRRTLVWVSKSPQWVVKLVQLHGKDAVSEQVLTAHEPRE